MNLQERIREVRRLRDEKDRLSAEADEAARAYAEAHNALWDEMDIDGVDSMKVDGVHFIKNKPKPYAQVQDKAALYQWAVEEGNAPELFNPEPRAGLLNERVRLAIDNGESLPPGLGFYTKQHVAQRRS